MIADVPRPAYVAAVPSAEVAARRVLVVLATLPGGRYEIETFDARANGRAAPLATMPVSAGRYGMTLGRDGNVYVNEGENVVTYRVNAAGTLTQVASIASSVQPVGAVDADGTVWASTYVPTTPPECVGPWWLLAHTLPIEAEPPAKPFIASRAIAGPSKILHLATGDLAVLDARPDAAYTGRLVYHIPEFRTTPDCNATPFADVPLEGQLDDITSDATGKIYTSLHLDTGAVRFAVYAPGALVPSRVIEPIDTYLFPYTKIAVDDEDVLAPFATTPATAAVRDDGIAIFDGRAGRKATPTRVISPTTWASRDTLVRDLVVVTPST